MSHRARTRMNATAVVLLLLLATPPLDAQVHHHADGRPWNQTADGGPDREVPGWFYNLGVTGIRVKLTEAHPKALTVGYVFEGTPAHGRIGVGDRVVGAGGKPFAEPHRNGYGMDVFGADGPILEFAVALERCLGRKKDTGALELLVESGDERRSVTLELGADHGRYAKTFPGKCPKSERLLAGLLDYLVAHQRDDGSWGSAPHDTFAPLALLASGTTEEHRAALEKNVRFQARTTKAEDSSWLINWRYAAAGIVLSEYHLATGEAWVLPELEEIRDFLVSSQYVDLSQVNEKTKEERPEDAPRDAMNSHGGWGHNPGFEGYGPISMLTGQGALAFALMARSGIDIDRERHDAAYAFLDRGTGPNGYVWYEDSVASPKDWADMGRTGASGLAHAHAPYPEKTYVERAREHAGVIGRHPESFPDTHGSPTMGMGYAAAAAAVDPAAFRSLMDANRWWFILAECPDGSFYYQPNRDNAGYGRDSRISASSVTAFILSIPRRNLAVTGRPAKEDAAPSEKDEEAGATARVTRRATPVRAPRHRPPIPGVEARPRRIHTGGSGSTRTGARFSEPGRLELPPPAGTECTVLSLPRTASLSLVPVLLVAIGGAAPGQSPEFEFTAVETTISYDVGTGTGSGPVSITNEQVTGMIAEVQGWFMAATNDASLVTPVAVQQGAYMQTINPDFYEWNTDPQGFTIGCSYCFTGCVTCTYEVPKEIAIVTYETVPGTLAGDVVGTTTMLTFEPHGTPQVSNVVVVGGASIPVTPVDITLIIAPITDPEILRGDANGDGTVEPLVDGIRGLEFLFVAGMTVPCEDAVDATDDGTVDIADPIWVLVYGFAGGPPPTAPFPACGPDPTADGLPCDASGCP